MKKEKKEKKEKKDKKDKKNKKNISSVLSNEPEITPPSPPPPPPVNEYDQPPISPYSTSIIHIVIGETVYGIPEYYLRPYPRFSLSSSWQRFDTNDINQDVGHTLVHFLYTGTYQTIAPSIEEPSWNPRSHEFERSVYAYQAARLYEVTGLENFAREYMCTFDDSVATLDILNIARKVYSTLPSGDTWFESFIRDKLVTAFQANEVQFREVVEQYGVGTESNFDRFLVATVMGIYSDRITILEDAVANRDEDDDVPIEEAVDEVVVEVPPHDVPPEVEAPYEEPQPASPSLDHPYQPPPSSFSSPRPVREPSPGFEPLEPGSEPEPEPEAVYDEKPPEPEDVCEAVPEPEPEAPAMPDSPLYDHWHIISSKERRLREKRLLRSGLPIPGRDFELPLRHIEPQEPEPVPEPECEPMYEAVPLEPEPASVYEAGSPEPELIYEPEPAPEPAYEPESPPVAETEPEAIPEPPLEPEPVPEDDWWGFSQTTSKAKKKKKFSGKSLSSSELYDSPDAQVQPTELGTVPEAISWG